MPGGIGGQTDPDQLFAYKTRKVVFYRERALGIAYNVIYVLIVCYIVFFMLLYNQGYYVYEQAKGATATHTRGDVLSTSNGKPGIRYFSAEEISYPGLENGNLFVATRQTVFHQTRGVCEDLSMRCSTNDQCTAAVGGTCSQNGFCEEPSWCLVEGDEMPEIYELDVENLDIWIKSSIEFTKLRKGRVYSTEHDHAFPERGFNLYSLRELLMKCEPTPVRYEEIAELVAVIEVNLAWDCNVDEHQVRLPGQACRPDVTARRLDTIFDPRHIGFSFSYSEPITEDERLLNEMKGVRFLFRTTGIARRVSVDGVIMKLATSTTLTFIPGLVVDILMLYYFNKKNKYRARKYAESPDFSDYSAQSLRNEQMKKEMEIESKKIDDEAKEQVRGWDVDE